MSVETITMLVGIVSILLALASGFGWMVHRMDSTSSSLESRLGARIDGGDRMLGARIDSVEKNLGARIDDVESKLGARIDSFEHNLGARIDKVSDELVEVKIAVARFEGPPRHLLPAR